MTKSREEGRQGKGFRGVESTSPGVSEEDRCMLSRMGEGEAGLGSRQEAMDGR